ncbi:MAG: ATP-binding cassette domain-containing protein, partial [Candidatus Poseidoniaceae archaeon]
MKSKKLIGLVGTNGSGKSTVCQILKEKKFLVIS